MKIEIKYATIAKHLLQGDSSTLEVRITRALQDAANRAATQRKQLSMEVRHKSKPGIYDTCGVTIQKGLNPPNTGWQSGHYYEAGGLTRVNWGEE